MLHIRSQTTLPQDALVVVPYKNHCFWIDKQGPALELLAGIYDDALFTGRNKQPSLDADLHRRIG